MEKRNAEWLAMAVLAVGCIFIGLTLGDCRILRPKADPRAQEGAQVDRRELSSSSALRSEDPAPLSAESGSASSPTSRTDGEATLPGCDELGRSRAGGGLSAIEDWVGAGELGEAVTPTAEGLFERTVVMWSAPDFLKLTAKEAREWLPVDDDLPDASLPGSLVSVLGGLPTIEDCERAVESPLVYDALVETCRAELAYYATLELPKPQAAQVVSAALATWNQAENALMAALDRETSFKNWRVYSRLYREFADE